MEYCYYCMSPKDGLHCTQCKKEKPATVAAHHLAPGTMLNGRFLIGTALGEGGSGITYIGRDVNLEIRVAIKEYYPNGFVNRNNTLSNEVIHINEEKKKFFEKGRKDFLNEARILAKFAGEVGIVDVRDFFEENNTAYIVMEYLEGTDLRSYLREHGTLSVDESIKLIFPVIQALEKVHKEGLIHRDISPDNIRLVDGVVKLIDFGSARDVASSLNKNSLSVVLKPGYAPMEQYSRKGKQGPWTDVYGLCATIYKCITGITPDDATDRIQADELKKPSELGFEVNAAVENVLMKGLSVSIDQRWQSIAELRRNLIEDRTEKYTEADEDDIKTVYLSEKEAHKFNNIQDADSIVHEDNTKKDNKKSKNILVLIAVLCVFVGLAVVNRFASTPVNSADAADGATSVTQSAENESTDVSETAGSDEGTSESVTATEATTAAPTTTVPSTTAPTTTAPTTTAPTTVTTTSPITTTTTTIQYTWDEENNDNGWSSAGSAWTGATEKFVTEPSEPVLVPDIPDEPDVPDTPDEPDIPDEPDESDYIVDY